MLATMVEQIDLTCNGSVILAIILIEVIYMKWIGYAGHELIEVTYMACNETLSMPVAMVGPDV